MNIIEAWKAAKVGGCITRGNGLVRKPDDNIYEFIKHGCDNFMLLDNNWEVVKEKKTRTFKTEQEGNVAFFENYDIRVENIYVPAGAKVTIEWEE